MISLWGGGGYICLNSVPSHVNVFSPPKPSRARVARIGATVQCQTAGLIPSRRVGTRNTLTHVACATRHSITRATGKWENGKWEIGGGLVMCSSCNDFDSSTPGLGSGSLGSLGSIWCECWNADCGAKRETKPRREGRGVWRKEDFFCRLV